MQRVAVEQPDLAALRDVPGQRLAAGTSATESVTLVHSFTDSVDACGPPRDAAPAPGRAVYRELYRRALLHGCAEALAGIEHLAAGDVLLAGVAAQLRAHQSRHPAGRAWRVAAAEHDPSRGGGRAAAWAGPGGRGPPADARGAVDDGVGTAAEEDTPSGTLAVAEIAS